MKALGRIPNYFLSYHSESLKSFALPLLTKSDKSQVKAFILEPGPRVEQPDKEGIIDVDGEVLARGKGTYKCEKKGLMTYDKLQITVDQGLATIFAPKI